MRRTLLLDENDLVMVVKEDMVSRIDENRGEMNRTEFVTYLLQCQLREHENRTSYVTRDELEAFTRNITDLMRHFLELFIGSGIELGAGCTPADIQDLHDRLEPETRTEEEAAGPDPSESTV